MRLIDADELIKRIGKWIPQDPCGREQTEEERTITDMAASVCMEIEETPTAYDKEKVLEELRNVSLKFRIAGNFNSSAVADRAIEIVEKGGLN